MCPLEFDRCFPGDVTVVSIEENPVGDSSQMPLLYRQKFGTPCRHLLSVRDVQYSGFETLHFARSVLCRQNTTRQRWPGGGAMLAFFAVRPAAAYRRLDGDCSNIWAIGTSVVHTVLPYNAGPTYTSLLFSRKLAPFVCTVERNSAGSCEYEIWRMSQPQIKKG